MNIISLFLLLPYRPYLRNKAACIGVNITASGRKLTVFSAISLSFKMSRFFAYFELGTIRSKRSVQRQVELRRLDDSVRQS